MIYVDLDGVLANFDAWAQQFNPKTDTEYMQLFIARYNDCFKDLEPIDAGLKMLERIEAPVILTAMPNHDEFLETGLEMGLPVHEIKRRYEVLRNNKLNWVARYVGEVPVIIVPSRKCKVNYAKGNTLIDDYYKNVDDWVSAGGNGILFSRYVQS